MDAAVVDVVVRCGDGHERRALDIAEDQIEIAGHELGLLELVGRRTRVDHVGENLEFSLTRG